MHHTQETLPVKAVVQRHYQIEAVLSSGEAGNTYLVRDKRLGQQRFILKEIIHPGGKVPYRFPIETVILQQLEHPALPRLYHAFTDARLARSYILVEFIAGTSALHLLSRQPEQRLGLAETMELMTPIMDAVAYLHRQRPPVIHRDIKPSNIIVSTSGQGSFLVDFGLAKQYDVDATTSILRFGSPGYCAPEQYSYQGTSPRADIYALGATFYKCLTGTVPIESVERVMQLYELQNDPLVPLDERMPDLPTSVVAAVHRALSIDSDTRFATVEQFREVLEQDSSEWLQQRVPIELMGLQEEEQPRTPGLQTLEEEEKEREGSDARSTPVLVGQERRQSTEVDQLPRSRRKQYLRAGSLVALVAALLLTVGMSLWWVRVLSSHSTSISAMAHIQVVRSHPTVPASLPVMKSYQGMMYNIVRNTRTVMFLIDVQRQQHTIRGVFHGPLWNALFVGMIDATGQLQFVTTDSHGQETFSFNGVMRGDGTLAGSYCEPMQNGKCRSYGLWSVVPAK
jgi:serine/threonine protein kinase